MSFRYIVTACSELKYNKINELHLALILHLKSADIVYMTSKQRIIKINNLNNNEISRRIVLKLGLITAVAAIVPVNTAASVTDFLSDERCLYLHNLHTKETLDVVYWKNGKYLTEPLNQINHIFRDHYNGSVIPIKTELMDLLSAIQNKMESREPYQLISGYRSPATNNRLRKQNKKVAKKSLHMKGKAADIRMPGHKLKELRQVAYELKGGGVGYYKRSNFVHIDVGSVRFWHG